MKKLYFLVIFIFTFGIVTAQEKLSKEEKERREKNIQAGNPFARFGYKAKVATLSKGKYLEFHDLDSIVTIGSIRFHVDKKQIVGNIVRDTLDPDAQPIGDTAGRWISPDPLSEEYPSWSPYTFVMNNPLKFNDPTGMAPEDPSTDVTKNNDGTYTVVGGKADGDKNIYVVDNNGKRTGDVIGESLTEHSFLDEKGKPVVGAIINDLDTSGINFLNLDIINNKGLTLTDYMANATGGMKYDFKSLGIKDRPEGMSKDQFRYRGMLFQGDGFSQGRNGSTTVFASARDFGNVAAGYVAGSYGLSWSEARTGFDSLQSYQQGGIATEGLPTQSAQRAGFNVGAAQYKKEHPFSGSLRGNYPPR